MGKNSGNRAGRLPRALRPLFGWLLLVLLLFGWHQYQELLERTRLHFTVVLPSDLSAHDAVSVTLDGLPVGDEQKYWVGSHTFKVVDLKIEPFITNFFGWYGGFSLGQIELKRAMGTLSVSANPSASVITITGPEFSKTLTNSVGADLKVPTDAYSVQAQYPHWSQAQNTTVLDGQTASCAFDLKFGALRLICNKDGATFSLEHSGQAEDSGDLPATVFGLPSGDYQIAAFYHQRKIRQSITVAADTTNDVPIRFVLGAVRISSVPPGASVSATNGDYLGQTPLELTDVTPQVANLYLSLHGYEPIILPIEVITGQTNAART